jgi:hypothetical protein
MNLLALVSMKNIYIHDIICDINNCESPVFERILCTIVHV